MIKKLLVAGFVFAKRSGLMSCKCQTIPEEVELAVCFHSHKFGNSVPIKMHTDACCCAMPTHWNVAVIRLYQHRKAIRAGCTPSTPRPA